MTNLRLNRLTFTLALILTGCGIDKPAPHTALGPIVTGTTTEVLESGRPSANPAATTSTSVKVSITVDKNALLTTEFLYGADLQYSSFYDKDMDLYNQSMAIGHIPARFRVAGDELQLVADNRRLFPSDVNHPEQLLSRFKILAQTDKEMTISTADSRVLLAEIFEGTHADTGGGLTVPTAKPIRDLWVRSFDFDGKGNYLLQQTSVVLNDGSVAEFMESIFPRDNIAPSSSFQKIEMDPTDPVGGSDGIVARFRYLPGEKIHDGEKVLAYAQHPDLSGTMEWYVTPNIPDEDLAPVQEAVEGWNRYFSKEKGVARNVMVFKGRLPDGIHIGDPRFNVINWDSRLVAGAAYETQATDPQTGKQSHSLIYMPAAWLKIGTDYWTNGISSDAAESVSPLALDVHGGVARSARIACLRDVREGAALLASGRLSADEIKVFGRKLLKQTLFHEVGHALGLAHNFKGSLAFDRSKPGSIFSTSIMDYNDFEIERAAFSAIDSSDGPLLEYDRQAISALHNAGADIAATDATLPTCNDAEADNEDGGVDPLCIRYDIENDPTLAVKTALDRVNLATKAGDVSLADAIRRAPELQLDDATIAGIKTKDDLAAAVTKLSSGVTGSLKFYVVTGKESLSRSVRTNVKSLLEFADGVLPADYNARQMRERAFTGVKAAVAMRALPDAVTQGVNDAVTAAVAKLAKAPYLLTLNATDAAAAAADLRKTVLKSVDNFVTGSGNSLSTLRTAVLAAIARHAAVPFFFGKQDDASVADFETALIGILGDATVDTSRSLAERKAAATALMTYAGRMSGDPAIKAAADKVLQQRALATSNTERETAETLAAVLTKK